MSICYVSFMRIFVLQNQLMSIVSYGNFSKWRLFYDFTSLIIRRIINKIKILYVSRPPPPLHGYSCYLSMILYIEIFSINKIIMIMKKNKLNFTFLSILIFFGVVTSCSDTDQDNIGELRTYEQDKEVLSHFLEIDTMNLSFYLNL